MAKIYESPDGGKTIKERELRDPSAQQEYTHAKIHANSPFNDGWTRQFYQDIVDEYELGWQEVSPDKFDDVMKDKKKWVLTVEECKDADTDKNEYFISFPEDLLEAAQLKEGDVIEWIDQGDGSYKLKKVEDHTLATYDDMIAAGFTMTDDGFWIKDK